MKIIIQDALYYCNIVEKIRENKEGIEKGSQAWLNYIGRINALESILEKYKKLQDD